MKKYLLAAFMLILCTCNVAMAIELKVNDNVVAVEWENNASVEALRNLIKDSPLTIKMSQYGGFEQVGSLGTSITRNDVQTTTQPGDIVLYSGNQIVIFYGSNSWAYTRLGKISGMSEQEIKNLLQGKDITITLSENTSNSLKSLEISISGDSSYSFTAGTGGTVNFTLNVTGTYDDDSKKAITSFVSSWVLGTISPSTTDISINNSGVLTVNSGIRSGDYTVPVKATATSNDITGETTRSITVKIVDDSQTSSPTSSSGGSGGGCNTGLGIFALAVLFKICKTKTEEK